jgi:D-serine deaminase-like pyridoxal phosphate-dependent protein
MMANTMTRHADPPSADPLTRRSFVQGVSAGVAVGAGLLATSEISMADEPALAHEPRPQTKADIPTPALLVDLGAFEANLQTLASHCRQAGCNFRPHAKTHKCPEIARRQIASGAIGISVATVPEAEAMAAAGIQGVLLTSPVVEPAKIARMAGLVRGGASLMLAVGHVREAELLWQAAEHAKIAFDVLVDLDVGDRRTGIQPGEPAVELAKAIGKHARLHVRGVQAYAGFASHVVGFEERQKTSREAMSKAVETAERLAKAGFDAAIVSGGSTGTYNIDSGLRGVTELQVGSYVFMDVDYRRIGGKSGAVYTDFQPSLSVLATVVSTTHADRVTIDAGTKAIDTTTSHRPEVKGRRPGLQPRWRRVRLSRRQPAAAYRRAGGTVRAALRPQREPVRPHLRPARREGRKRLAHRRATREPELSED